MTALAQPDAAASRTVLNVPGMHCAGCIGKVERGLTSVPGIAHARVNLSARTVTVTHGANRRRLRVEKHTTDVVAPLGCGKEPEPLTEWRVEELA